MINRLTMLLAGAATIALVTAGCGGDGGGDASATPASSSDSTAAAVSKAEYLKEANAGCRKARQGIEKEVAEFARLRRGREKSPPLYYAELAHWVLLPNIEDELEAVRALGPPPGPPEAEREIDRLLYGEELPFKAITFAKTVGSLRAIDRRFVGSSRRLREYGLPDCAHGPEATRLGAGLLQG